jgi:hypothetical protein
MILALTRLVIKINKLDFSENKETFNTFFFNTINIICAVLKIKSNKIFKDPNNISRINFCLECLINNEFDLFLNVVDESREFYNEYYYKLLNEQNNCFNKEKNMKTLIKNVDDYLNFRYVKNTDLEGIEVDEEIGNQEGRLTSNKNLEGKKGNKIIEVITGCEVKFNFFTF